MEELDLEKEQRRERLGWVFYGVGAMLFVVCGFYLQERVVLNRSSECGSTPD
jgi:hypothetical protein